MDSAQFNENELTSVPKKLSDGEDSTTEILESSDDDELILAYVVFVQILKKMEMNNNCS